MVLPIYLTKECEALESVLIALAESYDTLGVLWDDWQFTKENEVFTSRTHVIYVCKMNSKRQTSKRPINTPCNLF